MRKLRAAALALLLAAPAAGQVQIHDLPLLLSPADTDQYVLQTAGGVTMKTTRATLRSGLLSTMLTCPAHQFWASPTGATGLLGCRAIASSDVPATTIVMPADFSVSGTGPGTVTITRATQLTNLFLASPCGSTGTPGYRAFCASDFAAGLLAPAKIGFSTTSRLLGANGSGTGGVEILLGTGLSLSGSTLNATGGSGTVTSVGLALPSWLTVTGSPVTTSGTLTGAAATGQTTGRVIGTCQGATSFAPCVPSLATDVTGILQAAGFPILTGAITTTGGSLATSFGSGQTIPTPTLSGHTKYSGSAPSVSCTGLGTGGTSAMSTNSSDNLWQITLTVGTTAASSGTCTLTFSGSYTTNTGLCLTSLVSGTGTWSSSSVVIQSAESLTAPQFGWTNSNQGALVTLVNASTYKINGFCPAR